MKGICVPAKAGAVAVATAAALMLGTTGSSAQLGLPSIPDWVGLASGSMDSSGLLTIGGATLLTDPQSTQEELPGLGHKFELFGVMVRDTDPENPVGNPGASGGGVGGNETISATIVPGTFAVAFRNLPPGINIRALDNQLALKYYFAAPRNCVGGSPRITLLVDSDADGDTDFAAHGHVNPPSHMGCLMNKWVTEDLTDDLTRWEITPGGAVPSLPNVFPLYPWETVENAIAATFPNHKILAGFLVDDSCSFQPPTCGKAYYDLVTIENRTLEIWQDTVRK